MTTPPEVAPPCPECAGDYLPDHPAGRLMWVHTPACPLRAAEDATQAADHTRLSTRATLTRPATPTEIVLLGVRGLLDPTTGETTDSSDEIITHLSRVTASIVQRSWPELEPDDDDDD